MANAKKKTPSLLDVGILSLAARQHDTSAGESFMVKNARSIHAQDLLALGVLKAAARKDDQGILAAVAALDASGIEADRRKAVLGRALELVASDAPLKKAVMLTSKAINDFTEIHGIEKCCAALLDLGAPSDHQNEEGRCALHAVALAGTHGVMTVLLQGGVDPNIKSLSGDTALLMSAKCYDYLGARLLLRAGADPNARREGGVSPADASVKNGSMTDATWLIHAYGGEAILRRHWEGVNPQPTMVQAAARAGDVERMMELLDAAHEQRQGLIASTREYIASSMDSNAHRRCEMLASIDAYAAREILLSIANMSRGHTGPLAG